MVKQSQPKLLKPAAITCLEINYSQFPSMVGNLTLLAISC